MRNIFILIGIVILILVIAAYISLFTDFALPEQGCMPTVSKMQHAKTCLPPFSCKKIAPSIPDGICSL